MSMIWAREHFQHAKDLMPVDFPSWHLAEGLKQLTESLVLGFVSWSATCVNTPSDESVGFTLCRDARFLRA